MENYGECKLKEVGLKKWLENYLYHYRYITIGVVIGVFLLAFFVKDVLIKEKVDATILMPQILCREEQQAEIEALFNHLEPIDGDGKVNIKVNYIYYPDESDGKTADPQVMMGAQVKVMAEIQLCESNIFIFDKQIVDIYGEELFEDLSGMEISVPLQENQRMVLLSDTAFAELPGLEEGSGELYIGLRSSDTSTIQDKEKIKQKYEYQQELLLNFLNNNVVNPLKPRRLRRRRNSEEGGLHGGVQ